MKLGRLAFALIVLVGTTSFALAGERVRMARGVGLSGLASPTCGARAPGCCPVCGMQDPYGHVHRGPGIGYRRGGYSRAPGYGAGPYIQPGPPTAAITYPYYTVRGPRDFLQRNLSPIGP